MNKSMFKKIFIIDLKLGIKKRWIYYLGAFIIFILEISYFFSQCKTYYQNTDIYFSPGMIDCLLYVFCGTEKFTIESGTAFNIPSLWLLVNIYLMYIIGYYPAESIKKQSPQILTRCYSRSEFWLSKILWCIITTLLFILLLFIASAILLLFSGNLSFSYHDKICQDIMGFSVSGNTILLMLLPFSIILMTSIIQVNISLLISPILANFIMVVYMVCSVYYSNCFFVYNYCMFFRIFSENENNEINIITAIIFLLILSLISSVCAIRKLKKLDIT